MKIKELLGLVVDDRGSFICIGKTEVTARTAEERMMYSSEFKYKLIIENIKNGSILSYVLR